MARPVDEGGTAYGTNPVPTIGAQLYDNGPFSYGIPMSLFPGEQPRAVTVSEEDGSTLVDSQWYPSQRENPAEVYDEHPGYTGTAGWWGAPQAPPASGPVVNYEDTLTQPEYIQEGDGGWWTPQQSFEDGSEIPPLQWQEYEDGSGEWVNPGEDYAPVQRETVGVNPSWYDEILPFIWEEPPAPVSTLRRGLTDDSMRNVEDRRAVRY